MTIEQNESLTKKPLFNPQGDLDVRDRRMIGGNTTNLNDFNNMKYPWVSDWYRQAMNNFWIPEEINLGQNVRLTTRYSRFWCFLIPSSRRTCRLSASTSRRTR